jgi:hypothetical protein
VLPFLPHGTDVLKGIFPGLGRPSAVSAVNDAHGFQPFGPLRSLFFVCGRTSQPPLNLGVKRIAVFPSFRGGKLNKYLCHASGFRRFRQGYIQMNPVVRRNFYGLFNRHKVNIAGNSLTGNNLQS